MKKTIIMLLAMSGIASAALDQVASMSDLLYEATLGTGVTDTSAQYTNNVTVLHFDENNDAVIGITNSDVADIINAKQGYLTIAAWINPTSIPAAQHGADLPIFSYGPQQSGIKVGLKGETGGAVASPQETAKWVKDNTITFAQAKISEGEWQFVAFSIALAGGENSRYLTGDDAQLFWSNQDWGVAKDVPEAAQLFGIGSTWGTAKTNFFVGDIANLTIYHSASAATKEDLQAAGITALKPVPEPTTAALSLLALAGLCARRRRK